MNAEHYSLKKRLLLWVSIPVLIASLLIFLMAFLFSWHEIEEVYDAQLVHSAKTLLQLTEHEITERQTIDIPLGVENPNLQHRYENKTAFRIWQNEKLILQSTRAKDFLDLEVDPGFSDQTIEGKPWRFFVYIDADKNIRVETAERYAIRYELIGQLMISLAIPMAILIPSLLLIVWVGVRKSLKPLLALSSEVDSRKIDDLNTIQGRMIPSEVMPLVHALNRLFMRIDESFRREREFTDHAAHELRTPLAAMKTQTQVLMKKASAMPECRDGLKNLNATIDRSTHLLEQLLSLARLQNEKFPLSDMDLSECVQDALAELSGKAAEKEQNIRLSINEHVHIKGHSDSLFILIRNIIDNAIKYTPAKGSISISLNGEAKLTISDTGPGIKDSDKNTVFNRFVRMDKSGQTGSGLGLSIAQWVANAHNATLLLKDNAPNGLIVELDFNK